MSIKIIIDLKEDHPLIYNSGYPFTDGNYTYKANGIQHSFSPGDLIEEVPNSNINKVESKTITAKNAQRIIEVACSSWKTKLATQWGTAIALGDTIEISNDEYVKMRGVCTPNQHMLFDEIFGGDVWKMY